MRYSPPIVPDPYDRDIYLVLDDFGEQLGRAWAEADEERTHRETVIRDLLTGQYSEPVQVVAFNTAEGWSRNVSEEIADDLAQRLASDWRDVPVWLESFLDRHSGGPPLQLPLPLRGAA